MKPALVAASIFASLLLHAHAHAQVTSPTPQPSPQCPPLSLSSPSTWSPQLQAAVVGSGVTLLIAVGGGLLALLKYRREREDKRQAEAKAEEERGKAEAERERADQAQRNAAASVKSLEGNITDRIGYRIGSVVQVATIDWDGNYRTNWRWDDIRTVRADVQIPYIPGKHHVAAPDSQYMQYPQLVKQSFDRKLELRFTAKQKDYCEFQVLIDGSLNPGETLGYEYELAASKTFLMTKEEIEQHGPASFKKEFCGFNISTPIDMLEIYVTFPDGYQVTPAVGVCMGEGVSETLFHKPEISRILAGNLLKTGHNWAQVRIDEPVMGFSYFIYWEPPARAIVDQLRPNPVR